MIRTGFAALALAAASLHGSALGQEKTPPPRPTYEEAFAAVTGGGCERKDAENHIRFHCAEGRSLWYFTLEGRPEHPTYHVRQDYIFKFNGIANPNPNWVQSSPGFGRGGRGIDLEAFNIWTREINKVWREEALRAAPAPRRGEGKLYPLEPS